MPLRLLTTHFTLDLSVSLQPLNSCLARAAGCKARHVQTSVPLNPALATLSGEHTFHLADARLLLARHLSPPLTLICLQFPEH